MRERHPFLFGDSSWGYDTCMSCGWKEWLGWGEEVSEKGSVKQTTFSGICSGYERSIYM